MTLTSSLALQLSPAELLRRAHLIPDPWQAELLATRPRRLLLVTSRQAGKSLMAAALALWVAMTQPNALVLVGSPTQRQSAELVAKIRDLLAHLPEIRVDQESALRLTLTDTRARIVALPGSEATVRGYSGPAAVVLDEAAFIDDGLPIALSPMLATVPNSLFWVLSTPNGRAGWLFDRWTAAEQSREPWHQLRLPATDIPRISDAFLQEERTRMTDSRFRSEYMAEFVDIDRGLFASTLLDDAAQPADASEAPTIVVPKFGDPT